MIWDIAWNGGSYLRVNFLPADPAEARKIILHMNPARAQRVAEGKCTLDMRPSKWQPPPRSKKHLSTDYVMLPVRFTRAQVAEVKARAAKRHLTVSEFVRAMVLSE